MIKNPSVYKKYIIYKINRTKEEIDKKLKVLKELEKDYEYFKKLGPLDGIWIGNKVRIKKPSQIVYAYGEREGFPDSIIGKKGIVHSFDRYTKSTLKVYVKVDGKIYRGNPLDLDVLNA